MKHYLYETFNDFTITLLKVYFAVDDEEIMSRTRLVESLKTALRTQPMRFVIYSNINTFRPKAFLCDKTPYPPSNPATVYDCLRIQPDWLHLSIL